MATPADPAATNAAAAVTQPVERLWQIDAMRGLMLVLMTLTHLPTRFSSPAGQPFGFVSAAEGFVLLSGFMAGMVYARRQQREGDASMRSAFFKRVVKIYVCQVALLVFLFSFVALLGVAAQHDAISNLLSYYRQHPMSALAGGLLLVYKPPLLDILPMYIVFMLASPLVLIHGLQQGWRVILGLSVALWLGSQFGLGRVLYEATVRATHLPVPLEAIGAFKILAWQFLWVLGLWMGVSKVNRPEVLPGRFPAWLVRTSIAVALIGFVWRHAVGQTPFPGNDALNLMFDKWQLAPLRLINLFALLVLAMHYAPWLARRLPRWRLLETLGAASLPAFCAHLVVALLLLAVAGEARNDRPWAVDVAMLAFGFAVVIGVALISRAIDRQATQRAEVLTARAMRPKTPPEPDARRSPTSTPHSPQG